jgi:hypothetical protein
MVKESVQEMRLAQRKRVEILLLLEEKDWAIDKRCLQML